MFREAVYRVIVTNTLSHYDDQTNEHKGISAMNQKLAKIAVLGLSALAVAGSVGVATSTSASAEAPPAPQGVHHTTVHWGGSAYCTVTPPDQNGLEVVHCQNVGHALIGNQVRIGLPNGNQWVEVVDGSKLNFVVTDSVAVPRHWGNFTGSNEFRRDWRNDGGDWWTIGLNGPADAGHNGSFTAIIHNAN